MYRMLCTMMLRQKHRQESVIRVENGKKVRVSKKTGSRNRLGKEETILAARLKDTYKNNVFSALMDQFKYDNVMEVPKLEKVTINMGLGEAKENAKIMESAVRRNRSDHRSETDSDKSQKVHRKLQSKTGNACWR